MIKCAHGILYIYVYNIMVFRKCPKSIKLLALLYVKRNIISRYNGSHII